MQSPEWLVITLFVGAILGASTLAMWHVFRIKAPTFERVFEPRLTRGEIGTGAVFIAVSEAIRSDVIRDALRAARSKARPEHILRVWQRAGARVVAHVDGSGARSKDDAREWLRSKAEEFEREPLPRARANEALFALLYARTGTAITRIHNVDQAQLLFVPGSCVGVAFVACRTLPIAIGATDTSKRRLALLAFTVSLVATVGLVIATWSSSTLHESPIKLLTPVDDAITKTVDSVNSITPQTIPLGSVVEDAAPPSPATDFIDYADADTDEPAEDAGDSLESEVAADGMDAGDSDVADAADAHVSPLLAVDGSAPRIDAGAVNDAGAQVKPVRPQVSNPGVRGKPPTKSLPSENLHPDSK